MKNFAGSNLGHGKTRVNEQMRNTRNGEIDKSKIAEHSWGQKHRGTSIINKEEIQGSENSRNPRSSIVQTRQLANLALT